MNDAAAKKDFSAVAKKEILPQWNFSNFYTSPDSPEYEADFRKLEQWSADFRSRYEGKLATLSADDLAAAIQDSKAKDDLMGKLGTYVQLKQAQDSAAYTPAAEAFMLRITPLASAESFFEYEIKKIEESRIQAMLQESSDLRAFQPWLKARRKMIPHTPSLDIIRYGTEVHAAEGIVGLYDKWNAAKRFPFEGQDLSQVEIITISSKDPDPARRKAAHEVFVNGMKQDSLLMAHLFNERLRLKGVDDKWAKFDQPWDSMHLTNGVTAGMVDAMEQAVKEAYPRITHRFYKLKADLMGQDRLNIYDRLVDPFETADNDVKSDSNSFDSAKHLVLKAYRDFLPRMAEEAEKFFDNGWIDAAPGKNKYSGAFAHPGAARLANPMILLNHQGTSRDTMTMAHELGHGVHQILAAHKGDAIVESPMTFAETASIFGEMLTFTAMLREAENDDDRKRMLFDKIDNTIGSVFRQISFHDFEKRIHTAFKTNNRPLTEDEFAGHFVEALQDSYGPALPLDRDYGHIYSYVAHFMHVPFYVYAYSFADMLVTALYQTYEDGTVPDFKDKYIQMLEKGGTLQPKDLKEMFNLDIEDPSFWARGIETIEAMLDELEILCQPDIEKKRALMNRAQAAQDLKIQP